MVDDGHLEWGKVNKAPFKPPASSDRSLLNVSFRYLPSCPRLLVGP